MCSGCSGNYAGDFDEFGDPAGPWDEAESFTAEDWGSTQGRGSDESTAGVCEILLSATRIIEIRMIAADRYEINELPRGEAPKTPRNQHSRAGSAKYYQTWQGSGKIDCDCVDARFFPATRMWIAAGFRRWMCRARKRSAIARARNCGGAKGE
jgi:hypothetical protein